MEAILFTLDVAMLILLIRAVQKLGRHPDPKGSLGVFSFLEKKTDETAKGLGIRKGRKGA